MPATLLAIDVGTTAVRGAVIDATGRALAQAAEPCPLETPAPGWAEADAGRWWTATLTICRALAAETPLDRVDAIAVVGQAPSAVLVDADGTPSRRAILWLDVRAHSEARSLSDALGPERAERIGGNRIHPYYLGPKLAWLRAHEPRVLDDAASILQPHAFIVFRLTGERVADPSTAMLCAPLFDARAGCWSAEAARAAGVPLRLLPRVVASHVVVGGVSSAAAAATGLRCGVPVVAGGGDFAASALGAGVVDDGEASLMLGTAGNLLVPSARPCFDTRLIQSRHVGADAWLAVGGTLCGAALEWFRRAFGDGARWETLEAEAAAVDPASMGGLTCLPYLQGERTPFWDDSVRGAFVGVDLMHGRGHMYRALLEGIALGFRHCLTVAEEGRARITEVVAANGAGRIGLFRQILADAVGLPLVWSPPSPAAPAATLAGAAVLAGLGCGAFVDAREARRWRGPVVRHEPDERSRARLERLFAKRPALYAAMVS